MKYPSRFASLVAALSLGLAMMLPVFAQAQSLQGYWTLDDGTGSVALDSSGNGNHGTLQNGATWTSGEKAGAVLLDGQNDRVAIDPAPLAMDTWTAFTVSAWVKNDIGTGSGTDDIISWWTWPGDLSWLLTHHENNQYYFEIGGKGWISGGAVSTEWTHVAATYTGSAMRLYVNGSLVASANVSSGALPHSAANLLIGGQQDGAHHFDGAIDEVLLYDYALTDEEVLALSVIARDETAPMMPQNLQVTSVDFASVGLNWDASSDPESGVSAYEVYRDGNKVGETSSTSYTDSGLAEDTTYTYEVGAVNGDGLVSTLSTSVQATTLTDSAPPMATGATADADGVQVSFDEDLDPVTATDPANYSISGGVVVTAANLNPDGRTVTLTVSGAIEGVAYTLTISGVEDLSGNVIDTVEVEFTPVLSDPDLLAHWSLDETSGSMAFDVTGGGNDGVLTGDATWDDGSIRLDGSGDAVQVLSSPLALEELSTFSVMAWVKNDIGAGAGTDDIASQWNWPRGTSWLLAHYVNNQYLFELAGKGEVTGGTVSQDWTLVAGTYDGSTMRLFVNGAEVGSRSGVSGTLRVSSADIYIGGQEDGANFFDGNIDDVKLFSRALSVPDVQAAFAAGRSLPEPDSTAASTPQNLQVTAVDFSSVGLSWEASSDPESGVNKYEIYRDGGKVGETTGTTFTDSGLLEDTTYTYEVAAVNGAGLVSTASVSVQATTLTDAQSPSTTGVSADANGATIDFDEPLDPVTATDPANYSVSGGVTVVSASLSADGRSVTLVLSGAQDGSTYTLSISGVEDLAGNVVTPVELEFTPMFSDPSLLAHWSLNETSGLVAFDVTGGGNDGNLIGDATWDAGSIRLDGAGDGVRIPSSPLALEGLNQLTVMAWVKNDIGAGAGTDDIVSQWSWPGSTSWLLAQYVNNQYYFELGGKGEVYGGTADQEWNHVVGTYDGSFMRLYVNGVEVGSRAGVSGNLRFSAADIIIGGQQDGANFFDGNLDEVKLYSRALSANEVNAEFLRGEFGGEEEVDPDPNPSGADLLGAWDLDEGSGSIAGDDSGSGNDGSVVSANWSTGILGAALEFNGSTSRVEIDPAPFGFSSRNKFSVVAWIKNDIGAGAGTDDIVSQWSWPGDLSWLITHHENDQYYFEIAGKGYVTGGVVSQDWTMVTGTYDGSTMRLYQNNQEVGSLGGLSGTLPPSLTNLIIGGQGDGAHDFDGLIDQVKIYDDALTALDIEDLYNNTLGVVPGAPAVEGEAPQPVQFTADDMTGDIVSYLWDFGDGTTSSEQNPEHTYAENGSYLVTLTATSASGTVYQRSLTVNVGEQYTSNAPIINIWYGDNQRFGDLGTTQVWLNILGDVATAPDADLASFTFSLNGGDPVALSVGPDQRRLAYGGDFNVEMNIVDVINGDNVVEIVAIDTFGETTVKTVNFHYNSTTEWPLPYSVNWDSVTDIPDAAQIVDGFWALVPGGVRIQEKEYDRVLTVGDVLWEDYEITVPITVHDFDPGYLGPISVSAGFGITLKWTGHTDDPVFCPQPHCGWLPSGAGAWYDIGSGGPLILDGDTDSSVSINPGDTYIWKYRVENVGVGYLYSLKVWEQGTPEPTDWNLVRFRDSDMPSGSIVLNCHHVDATFGDIEIVPLP